ncbi:helix-turn-helix transcriptional regulator [Parasedimentitalea psychrophila]|uniref:Helix-turn-helix transcriptional regulator n=1 Tax=Parasedimentitalea psychrophila TaxID=2997337 RepID=A0A9Y2P630_9RHOB|nr:helix-turn-helix transcriptional regulator [Parasedimentitalea psychrophila]WIY24240.1 helix-turn-helix transcriptional regulator [Parasedimentitalea psychrophila]
MKEMRKFSDIAQRLVWHRKLTGLTQLEYATKAGLKRAQLNNWENGDYRISVDGALALRETYGMPLDFIYLGDQNALPMALRNALIEARSGGENGG